MTHTYATMDVSPATFDEIRSKLDAAGYGDQIERSGIHSTEDLIDMHGIALVRQAEPEPTPHADAKTRTQTRAGKPTL